MCRAIGDCLEGVLGSLERVPVGVSRARALPPHHCSVGVDRLICWVSERFHSEIFLRHLQLGERTWWLLVGAAVFWEGLTPGNVYSITESGASLRTSAAFCMAGWFRWWDWPKVLSRGGWALCPRCTCIWWKEFRRVRCCWAVRSFLSLPIILRNIWSCPVEAMAAGLPVVSDWDSYRHTVSEGVEGFRIPTCPPLALHKRRPGFAARPRPTHLSGLCRGGCSARGCRHRSSCSGHCAAARSVFASAWVMQVVKPFVSFDRSGRGSPPSALCRVGRSASLRWSLRYGGSSFLRADPFRDFAPFATATLDPDTELRLAMPLPELQHRLTASPAWIAFTSNPRQSLRSGETVDSASEWRPMPLEAPAHCLAWRAAWCSTAFVHMAGEAGLYWLV